MAKYRCDVCGYIHDDAGPPVKCPKCGAGSDSFYDMDEEAKLTSILDQNFEDEDEEELFEAS